MKKLLWALSGLIPILCSPQIKAAVYYGNQVVTEDPSFAFNGVVGTGSLNLSDNGSTISGVFNRGGGSGEQFGYSLVLFIDSVAGGVADTTQITDNARVRTSVSGRSASGYYKSSVIFASGFKADYALVLNANQDNSTLFRINSDSSLTSLKGINLSTIWPYSPTFGFSLNWSDISGGGPNVTSFKFQSTYLDPDGYRSLESFEPMSGSIGYNTTTFLSYNSYPTQPVPEPTNLALAGFGGLTGIVGIVGWARKRLKECGMRSV